MGSTESPPAEITGGCACKAVRYRVTSAPITTRICWCRFCQYLSAGNGSVNVVFYVKDMTISGETTSHRAIADSGNVVNRRFCPKCGTTMFSEAEVRPHLIVVRAGTLDDTSLAKPSLHIWTSSAPSYACLDPNLPRTAAQPPPAA